MAKSPYLSGRAFHLRLDTAILETELAVKSKFWAMVGDNGSIYLSQEVLKRKLDGL